MNFNQAVEYIHSLLQFGIKPGLERISMLLEALGNPQNKVKTVQENTVTVANLVVKTEEEEPTIDPMAGLSRVNVSKVPQFSGKKKVSADAHVAQFLACWKANGHDKLDDQLKINAFIVSLQGNAIIWFDQYENDYFKTFEMLKATFLGRYRTERTTDEVLKKIRHQK